MAQTATVVLSGSRDRGRRDELLNLIVLVVIVAAALWLSCYKNVSFLGTTDETRMLASARAWLSDFPHVAENHNGLRHPVILWLAAAIGLGGATEAVILAAPRLHFIALLLLTYWLVRRNLDTRTALIATFLVGMLPFFGSLSSTIFPTIFETTYVVAALCLFFEGVRQGGRVPMLVLCGLAAGLAWEVRETTAGLMLVFGALFLAGYAMPRRRYLWIGLGFLLVLGLEVMYLASMTGDPLYRMKIDLGHIHTPSTRLLTETPGKDVTALFNMDLARHWSPSGPVRVHWLVDPYLNLVMDPRYAFILGFAVIGLLFLHRRADSRTRAFVNVMALLAVCWFVTVTYVLALRPQPRYYGPLVLTGAVISAAYLNLLIEEGSTKFVASLCALLALYGVWSAVIRYDQQYPARALLDDLSEIDEVVYVSPHTYAISGPILESAISRDEIRVGRPPAGALYLADTRVPNGREVLQSLDTGMNEAAWAVAHDFTRTQDPVGRRIMSAFDLSPEQTEQRKKLLGYESVVVRRVCETC